MHYIAMRLRIIFFCLMLLLFTSPAYASPGERVEMTIRLQDNGTAHVTIASMNPPNFEDLRGIINEPKVVTIYQERLSQIFNDMTNLRLYTKDRSVVIEFDCRLGEKKEGVWTIQRVDFKGILDPASVLRIELPAGTKTIKTNPLSSETREGYLTWNDADFIPHVKYIEETSSSKSSSFKYALIILLVLIAVLIVKKRTS